MLFRAILALAASLALASPASAKAKPKKQHVHDHGHAKLGVAVEGDTAALDLEIPGDDVFGFEHEAKSDADKKTVDDAMAALNGKALELFVFPADLGCAVAEAKAERHQDGDHGDVDAAYKIKCQKPLAGATIKLGLFARFKRLRQVKVQVNAGAKQSAQDVSGPETAISL